MYIYIHIYTHTHTYIYIYIHIYIYTYIDNTILIGYNITEITGVMSMTVKIASVILSFNKNACN